MKRTETPILPTSHLPLSLGLGNVKLEVAMFKGLDWALPPQDEEFDVFVPCSEASPELDNVGKQGTKWEDKDAMAPGSSKVSYGRGD